MPAASINRTALSLGLVVSALGLGLLVTSPADARTRYLPQRTHGQQVPAFTQWSYGTPGVYRNTPPGNVVCWTPCGHPGSIVMGADPDPFIRQQSAMQAASSAAAGDKNAQFSGAGTL
jgi:hypothetical protein